MSYVGVSSAPRRLARLVLSLVGRTRHEPIALLVAAAVLIGCTWLFLGIVEDVVTGGSFVEFDRGAYDGLQSLRTGWGDDIMVTITELGSAFVTIFVIAAVALWFALIRRWRPLAYWIAAATFAELLVVALKFGVGRARPDTPYAAVDEFSFPSGHAALSIVVYGFLAFLLGNRKPAWQQGGFALAAVGIATLVAFSRLYLGAHWLSDVGASFALAAAWIALLGIAYMHHERGPPLRAAPVVAIVLASLVLVGGWYADTWHARDLARYVRRS